MWGPTVDRFVAGGAVVIGLANAALRRAVTEPVVTAQREFEAYEDAEMHERGSCLAL